MMKRFLLFFSVFAVSFSASVLLAQGWGSGPSYGQPPVFREIPGEMEFTGEMIVRPLPLRDLILRTGGVERALMVRAAAIALASRDAYEYVPETDEFTIKLPRGMNENTYARRMMTTGYYHYVTPNWRVYPVLIPNDPLYSQQWHHPRINSPLAWDILVGNPNQIVAVCDTGIDLTHPDLAPNRVPGYNAVDQLTEGQGGQVNDINGHGTHVAGCAAAIGNNGIGVTGVGWNFRIMMVRVTNSSGGSSSMTVLTRGARWAVDNGAKTISVSYSGVSDPAVQTTGQYIKSRGGLLLWAAGNSNTNLTFQWADVVVVGATDSADNKASFSSYGRGVSVFAPGVNILSTTRGSTYGTMSGTSMATPIANGVAAMIWARFPSWTPDMVQWKLYTTCRDLGAIGRDDYFGWGRVDVAAAVSPGLVALPSSFTVSRGSVVSGNLDSLLWRDSNSLTVNGAMPLNSNDPFVAIVVSGTSLLRNPVQLDINVVQSANTTGLRMTIEAYNFTTGTWQQVDSRGSTTSDSDVVVSITTNASQFINSANGEVRVRLRAFPMGMMTTWPPQVRYNYVRWTAFD
ncbi:MAG: S8 family serine peptidase [Candidatus Caldarchaeum sp.]